MFLFFFPPNQRGEQRERQEVGLPPGRSIFFGAKTPLRELPVSLMNWGRGCGERRGAGTGLEEECSSNFT